MNDIFMPDWSEAPDWANWHAVDEDLQGCWYAACPVWVEDGYGWFQPFRQLARRNRLWHYDPATMRDSE